MQPKDANIKYVNITDDNVNKFLVKVKNDIEAFDNSDCLCNSQLLAFYRGSLSMGVKLSNALNKNLIIGFFQTRDKKEEPISTYSHKIETNTPMFVVEDIIDSGKTIDLFLQSIIGIAKYPRIIKIYALVGNDETIERLHKKYSKHFDSLEFIYETKYIENVWYIFPWELIDENQSEKRTITPVDVVNTHEELLANIMATYSSCIKTIANKNHDYNAGEHPLDNFFNVEKLNITSAEKGILVRLSDKLSRITSLIDKQAKVKDESIYDTIDDAINYFALLKEVIKYKKAHINNNDQKTTEKRS